MVSNVSVGRPVTLAQRILRTGGGRTLKIACLFLFTINPIRYRMTGLTITNIQSSESLEMIEARTELGNTQGLSDHLVWTLLSLLLNSEHNNNSSGEAVVFRIKQPATN